MNEKNDLIELRKMFLDGTVKKSDYIRDMYKRHDRLFEYADFIRETDIGKIEIDDGRVIMTSRPSGVRIECTRGDERIPPIETLNFNRYEPEDSNMMARIIDKCKVFFDIGANIGWFSLLFAKSDPGLQVFAFEPIPKTFTALQTNVKLNGLANIKCFNTGFWKENTTLKFYFYPEGSAAASAADILERDSVNEISCSVRKLDDFYKENKVNIDFIKCDVEGAELFVFQGGQECLAKCKPVVFAEMLRKWSAKFNYHPDEIIELMGRIGYKCFTARGGVLHEVGRIDENTQETNFFFLHPERHASMIKSLVR